MADDFNPYYAWLGIPPEDQPADYYQLLGLSRFEDSAEVINNAADQRMSYVRTFQTGSRSPISQKVLTELSKARVCLLNTEKRTAYNAQLQAQNQQAALHATSLGQSVILLEDDEEEASPALESTAESFPQIRTEPSPKRTTLDGTENDQQDWLASALAFLPESWLGHPQFKLIFLAVSGSAAAGLFLVVVLSAVYISALLEKPSGPVLANQNVANNSASPSNPSSNSVASNDYSVSVPPVPPGPPVKPVPPNIGNQPPATPTNVSPVLSAKIAPALINATADQLPELLRGRLFYPATAPVPADQPLVKSIHDPEFELPKSFVGDYDWIDAGKPKSIQADLGNSGRVKAGTPKFSLDSAVTPASGFCLIDSGHGVSFGYMLEMEITRQEGDGPFYLGLSIEDAHTPKRRTTRCFVADGWKEAGYKSGMLRYYGATPGEERYQGAFTGQVLKPGQKSRLQAFVVSGRVSIFVDGKRIYRWEDVFDSLGNSEPISNSGSTGMFFVGSDDASFMIQNMTLTHLSSDTAPPTIGQIRVGGETFDTSFVGLPLKNPPLAHTPRSNMARGSSDLQPNAAMRLAQLDFEPPDEYLVDYEVTRQDDGSYTSLFVPVAGDGEERTTAEVLFHGYPESGYLSGVHFVNGKPVDDPSRSSEVATGTYMVRKEYYKLRVMVLKNRLFAYAGGKLIFAWQGSTKDLQLDPEHFPLEPTHRHLYVGDGEGQYNYFRMRVYKLTPAAKEPVEVSPPDEDRFPLTHWKYATGHFAKEGDLWVEYKSSGLREWEFEVVQESPKHLVIRCTKRGQYFILTLDEFAFVRSINNDVYQPAPTMYRRVE